MREFSLAIMRDVSATSRNDLESPLFIDVSPQVPSSVRCCDSCTLVLELVKLRNN